MPLAPDQVTISMVSLSFHSLEANSVEVKLASHTSESYGSTSPIPQSYLPNRSTTQTRRRASRVTSINWDETKDTWKGTEARLGEWYVQCWCAADLLSGCTQLTDGNASLASAVQKSASRSFKYDFESADVSGGLKR